MGRLLLYNENVASEATLQNAVDRLNAVRREIAKIIVGQDDVVEGVLICLLSGGHVLLEGVPGLGKTTLLRTLARTLHLKYSRIQFLSLIHISEPTRLGMISYAVFC